MVSKKVQNLDPEFLDAAQSALVLHPTERDYVESLARLALEHRAVRHPYLEALGSGTNPDTRRALTDFARCYAGYSAHFPRYLATVISRLENPAHRAALLANMTEESGHYDDEELAALEGAGIEREWILGTPHPVLFRRFATAMGVAHDDQSEHDAVACWRELFMQVLSHGSAAEAIGALGLGTENIVRAVYAPIVAATSRLTDLSPRDVVFFPLHTTVDDHHQATLAAIAADFAGTPEGRVGLRRGMLKALLLRSAFWDWLHERALDPQRTELGECR